MANRTRSSRLNQRVSGAASKLDDHKLLLGLLVAVVGAFLAYVAFVSTTGPPFQSKYQIEVQVPADAPPLRIGQAVRISGKLAGLISDVEPDRENHGTIVTANITKPEFRPIGTDATARVTVHSIVYHTYLELFPGDTSDPMENGGTIVQANVSSGVDLLEVVQLFDEEARDSLQKTTVNVGYGVAGRGQGLNQAFATSEPTATNLNAQLSAVNSDPGAVGRGIAGAAAVSEGLEGNSPDDVSALLDAGATTGVAIADRRTELAETIQLLPPFEDQFLETAPAAEALFGDLTEDHAQARAGRPRAQRGAARRQPPARPRADAGGRDLADHRRGQPGDRDDGAGRSQHLSDRRLAEPADPRRRHDRRWDHARTRTTSSSRARAWRRRPASPSRPATGSAPAPRWAA